jgi:hypothetical protein
MKIAYTVTQETLHEDADVCGDNKRVNKKKERKKERMTTQSER